ncbi:Hypothetical predicted protein [Pelobates cultripes]|uniref:Uncharacterized protein n=1 Tax=Pelobates cultripes TaxID=61616 RepID=A0AAD1WLE9_PELCU|nr:Hypothetical predicted protein [Pelobates cultripes]
MGKRHKKLKALSGEGTHNISNLLQHGPKPKMAVRQEPNTSGGGTPGCSRHYLRGP